MRGACTLARVAYRVLPRTADSRDHGSRHERDFYDFFLPRILRERESLSICVCLCVRVPADVSWHVAPMVGALGAPAGHALPLRPRPVRIVHPGPAGEAGQAGQVGTLQGYLEDLLVEGAIPTTLPGMEAPGAVRQADR